MTALQHTLEKLVERDPEQEVRDMAIPAVDAALEAARRFLGADDPLVAGLQDIISPERVESQDEIRAADVLIVVSQLQQALYEPPRPPDLSGPSRWR